MKPIDADSHVFEPAEIWSRHLDPALRSLASSAFSYRIGPTGVVSVILNGKPGRPMGTSKLLRQALWQPGMTPDGIGGLDPKVFRPPNPAAFDPHARLAEMDALGVEQSILFPTLFLEYLPAVENPLAAAALARAYNDWVGATADTAPDRLHPLAILPMQDANLALEEAERVTKLGFRGVCVRPAFHDGRFLVHPDFDPLWIALESAGLAVAFHPSPGHTNPEWTSEGAFVERVAAPLAIGHPVAESVSPLMDGALTLNALLFCGHLENYPRLKVAFAHCGASWLSLALEKAETYLTLTSPIRDITLEPEEVFYGRPSLVGFDAWEVSVGELHDMYGRVGAWGSRYPHHDTTTPEEALEMLSAAGVPPEVVRALMGGNAARFYGL